MFLLCREELEYERKLVKMLVWMIEQDDCLANILNSEHFLVSSQLDGH